MNYASKSLKIEKIETIIKNRHKSKNIEDYYLLKNTYKIDYFKMLKNLHEKKISLFIECIIKRIYEIWLYL